MRDQAKVRRATIDDVEPILDLRAAIAAEGVWLGAELPLDRDGDRAKHEASLAAMGEGDTALLLVAEIDDDLVGSLSLQAPFGLADLGMQVAVGHRGAGIGQALLEAGIEWARAAGHHKITLQHWPWNIRAHALYERMGFVEEGYLRRHYPRRDGSLWDAVMMGLVLDHDRPGHDIRATEPPDRVSMPVRGTTD